MHGHPASSSVTTVHGRDNLAPSPYHQNPHSQVPNNPNQLAYYGVPIPQAPGQYVYAPSGEIRQMSAVQSKFMNAHMAYMMQEIASEYSADHNENDTTPEDDISRELNHLAIDGASSSSRSALTLHASSSTVARRGDEGPRHIIIPGDYTEVDNNTYRSNFDSFKNQNNYIENSFGVRGKFVNVP